MYTNNFEQLINFFYFITTGLSLGIVFDFFRVLRKSFKTTDMLTNIEDVMFGLITGLIILSSIFLFNNGQLRIYIFVSIGLRKYYLSIIYK